MERMFLDQVISILYGITQILESMSLKNLENMLTGKLSCIKVKQERILITMMEITTIMNNQSLIGCLTFSLTI